MKCSLFPFFFLLTIRWGGGGGGISGRVRALNLTVPLGSGRVGSDNLGYGPGSGFSFEPVQTSSLEPWALFVNIVVSEIEQKTILQFKPLQMNFFFKELLP